MKHIKTYILLLLAVLFTACAQDTADSATDGVVGNKMSVNMGMTVPTWAEVCTRAGVATADIGIAAGSMQLLCFDKNGFYLGMGEQVTISPTTNLTGGIKAEVPASTCRVHFIANAALTEQSDWIGMYENTLISSLTAAVGDKMVYWGYVSKSTPAEMKAFLEDGNNTVYMLRDVAKVSVVSTASNVSSVSLVVSNDADKGTLAPFDDTNLSDPFGYDSTYGADGSYVPTDASLRTATSVGTDTEQYIFESLNNASQQVFAILKITYTTGTVRYHKIIFIDENYQYYTIKRNHNYEITVGEHSETGGYATFNEAMEGEPSNDHYITLTDKVPSITIDDYTLTIDGETNVIYNETGLKTITFTTEGETMQRRDFTVAWKSADDGLTTTGELQLAYSNGKGTISFPINTVTTDLRKGVLVLTDNVHRIRRHINVYATTPFEFNGSLSKSSGGDSYFLSACGYSGSLTTPIGTATDAGYSIKGKTGTTSNTLTFAFVYKKNDAYDTEVTANDFTLTQVSCDDATCKYNISKLLNKNTVKSTGAIVWRFTVKPVKQNSLSSNVCATTFRVSINGMSIDFIAVNMYNANNTYSLSDFKKKYPNYNTFIDSDSKAASDAWHLNFTIPDNYPTDLLPVTVRIASNDFNPIEPTCDVVVDDTEAITGQTWNFWYEYSAETHGEHTISLSKSRETSSGNELWLSADYFKPQKIEFSY